MNDPDELLRRASAIVGTEQPVLAAGIFGLKDDYLAVGAGTAAGAGLSDTLVGDPLARAVGGAVGIHATRAALAASQGLTVRMLVAVTPDRIRVLDWETGSGPTKELVSFDRSTTEVTVSRFGLSRHLDLRDPASGTSLTLSGSTAPFASESKGDKAVLQELSASR